MSHYVETRSEFPLIPFVICDVIQRQRRKAGSLASRFRPIGRWLIPYASQYIASVYPLPHGAGRRNIPDRRKPACCQ